MKETKQWKIEIVFGYSGFLSPSLYIPYILSLNELIFIMEKKVLLFKR